MILSGLRQLVEVLSFDIEDPELKSYVKRGTLSLTFTEVAGREGWAGKEKESNHCTFQIPPPPPPPPRPPHSNEQSYFGSVAGTWQLFFEFLKKKKIGLPSGRPSCLFPFLTHILTTLGYQVNVTTYACKALQQSFLLQLPEWSQLCRRTALPQSLHPLSTQRKENK